MNSAKVERGWQGFLCRKEVVRWRTIAHTQGRVDAFELYLLEVQHALSNIHSSVNRIP